MLTLYHDQPLSHPFFEAIDKDSLLDRLRALDARVNRKGLGALDPGRNRLIRIGAEMDGNSVVTKNGYGVFNLSWQVPDHPEWPDMIEAELSAIRDRIHVIH